MRKAKTQSIELWLGTEKSFDEYNAKVAEGESLDINAMSAFTEGGENDNTPYLLEMVGATAVIHINGSLTNSDRWYNSFLKIPSYNAIKEALVFAATDKYTEQIVLNVNSGGGPVAGIADTSALIAQINADVMPVYTYTESMLCSAAYWLASSAGSIFASELATVGSIGVIATHIESSKQLEEDGIKVTLVRAGEHKALANPYEPLTDKARAGIQEQIDGIYDVFTAHVADARNRTQTQVISTMAEGREFLGKPAYAVGLIDGVTSLDKLLSKLEETSLDTAQTLRQTSTQQPNGANPMKTRLTAQQIAIKAAGGSVAIDAGTTETIDQAAIDAAALLAETEGTEPAAKGEGETQPEAVTGSEVTLFTKETVDLLQSQSTAKDAQILDLSIQLAKATTATTEGADQLTALVSIAAAATNNMRVALGVSAIDMASLGAAEVVAQHTTLSSEFTKKFAIGGVAAVEAATEANKKPQVTGLSQARLASVGAKQTK